MDATDDDVLKLIQEYVEIIRCDHHKSRDLVFTVEKGFGGFDGDGPIRYWVEHPGYNNEWSGAFQTYREALNFMAESLQQAIARERSIRRPDGSLE